MLICLKWYNKTFAFRCLLVICLAAMLPCFFGCQTSGIRYFSKISNTNFINSGSVALPLNPQTVFITRHLEHYLFSSKLLGNDKGYTDTEEVFDVDQLQFYSIKSNSKEYRRLGQKIKGLLAEGGIDIPANVFIGYKDEFGRGSFPISFIGNGYYLIAGGLNNDILNDAELRKLDQPKALARFKMHRPRLAAVSTDLGNGQVLITGGDIPSSSQIFRSDAELFNLKDRALAPVGSLIEDRVFHSATLLKDGRVLIVGGRGLDGEKLGLKKAEIYDQKTRSFKVIGKTHYVHCGHTATLLGNGFVLIAGGYSNDKFNQFKYLDNSNKAELFNPDTNQFIDVSPMTQARANHVSLRLRDKVLILGGSMVDQIENYDSTSLKSAEIFEMKGRNSGI